MNNPEVCFNDLSKEQKLFETFYDMKCRVKKGRKIVPGKLTKAQGKPEIEIGRGERMEADPKKIFLTEPLRQKFIEGDTIAPIVYSPMYWEDPNEQLIVEQTHPTMIARSAGGKKKIAPFYYKRIKEGRFEAEVEVETEKSRKDFLRIDAIKQNGGTQPRAEIDKNTVEEYRSIYRESDDILPPVTVFYDGKEYWLADGFHRISALAEIKPSGCIPANIQQGSQRDAKLFAFGANASHGLRRSNADKRRAVFAMLRDREWSGWSNREIARRCKVSEGFVRACRKNVAEESSTRSFFRNGKQHEMSIRNIESDTGAIASPESEAVSVAAEAIASPESEAVSVAAEAIASPKPEAASAGAIAYPKPEAASAGAIAYPKPEAASAGAIASPESEAVSAEAIASPKSDKPSEKASAAASKTEWDTDSWQTPQEIIDLVCRVFNGKIDLDPTTNSKNPVKALSFFTKKTNCLMQEWNAETCYMNPPYSNSLPFIKKLCEEYKASRIKEAILLVKQGIGCNVSTGALIGENASALCEWRGRIAFNNNEGKSIHGTDFNSNFYYIGHRPKHFGKIFEAHGNIWLSPYNRERKSQ